MSTHQKVIEQSPLVYKRGRRLGGWHPRALVLLTDGSLVSQKQKLKGESPTPVQSERNPLDLGNASQLIDDADINVDDDNIINKKNTNKNKKDGNKGPVISASTVISPVQYTRNKIYSLSITNPDVARRVYVYGWKSKDEANQWMELLQRLRKQKKQQKLHQPSSLSLMNGSAAKLGDSIDNVIIATTGLSASAWDSLLQSCLRNGNLAGVIALPVREWGHDLFSSSGLGNADSSVVVVKKRNRRVSNGSIGGSGSDSGNGGGGEVARGLAGMRIWRSFREFTQAVMLWWIQQPLESRNSVIFVGDVRFMFSHSERRKLPPQNKTASAAPASSSDELSWQHVSGISKGTQAFLLGSDVVVHGSRCSPPLFARHDTGLRSEHPPLVCVLHAGDIVCIATASRWVKERSTSNDNTNNIKSSNSSETVRKKERMGDQKEHEKEHEDQFPLLPQMMHVSLSSWEDPSHAPLIIPTMRRHTISACRVVVLRPRSTVEQGTVRTFQHSTFQPSTSTQTSTYTSTLSSPSHLVQTYAGELSWTLDIDLSKSQTGGWVTQVMAALEIDDVSDLCGFRDAATGVIFYYSHRSTMQACNISASHLAGCKLFGLVLVIWPTFPFPYLRPETIRLMPHAVDTYANAKSQSNSQSFLRHARIATLECDTVLLQRAIRALVAVPLLDDQLATAPPRARLLLGDSSQLHMYLRTHAGLSTHRMSVARSTVLRVATQLTRAIGVVSAVESAISLADQALVLQFASAVKRVLAVRLARARRVSADDGSSAASTTGEWERSSSVLTPSHINNNRSSSNGYVSGEEAEGNVKTSTSEDVSSGTGSGSSSNNNLNRSAVYKAVLARLFNDAFTEDGILRSHFWDTDMKVACNLGRLGTAGAVLVHNILSINAFSNVLFQDLFSAVLVRGRVSMHVKKIVQVQKAFSLIRPLTKARGLTIRFEPSDFVAPFDTVYVGVGGGETTGGVTTNAGGDGVLVGDEENKVNGNINKVVSKRQRAGNGIAKRLKPFRTSSPHSKKGVDVEEQPDMKMPPPAPSVPWSLPWSPATQDNASSHFQTARLLRLAHASHIRKTTCPPDGKRVMSGRGLFSSRRPSKAETKSVTEPCVSTSRSLNQVDEDDWDPQAGSPHSRAPGVDDSMAWCDHVVGDGAAAYAALANIIFVHRVSKTDSHASKTDENSDNVQPRFWDMTSATDCSPQLQIKNKQQPWLARMLGYNQQNIPSTDKSINAEKGVSSVELSHAAQYKCLQARMVVVWLRAAVYHSVQSCLPELSPASRGGCSIATASDGMLDSYSDQHLVRAGEAVDRAVQVLVGKCSSVGGTSRKYEVAQRYFPGEVVMLCQLLRATTNLELSLRALERVDSRASGGGSVSSDSDSAPLLVNKVGLAAAEALGAVGQIVAVIASAFDIGEQLANEDEESDLQNSKTESIKLNKKETNGDKKINMNGKGAGKEKEGENGVGVGGVTMPATPTVKPEAPVLATSENQATTARLEALATTKATEKSAKKAAARAARAGASNPTTGAKPTKGTTSPAKRPDVQGPGTTGNVFEHARIQNLAVRRHMLVVASHLVCWLKTIAPVLHSRGGAMLGHAATRRTHNWIVKHGLPLGHGASEHLCLQRIGRLQELIDSSLAHMTTGTEGTSITSASGSEASVIIDSCTAASQNIVAGQGNRTNLFRLLFLGCEGIYCDPCKPAATSNGNTSPTSKPTHPPLRGSQELSRTSEKGAVTALLDYVCDVGVDSSYGFNSASVLKIGVLDRERFLLSDLENKYTPVLVNRMDQNPRMSNLTIDVQPPPPHTRDVSLIDVVGDSDTSLNHDRDAVFVYSWGLMEGLNLDQEQAAREKHGHATDISGTTSAKDESNTVENVNISGTTLAENKNIDNRKKVDAALIPRVVGGFPASKVAVRAIACGYRHTAIVTQGGLLMTFGHGEAGRLGHGSDQSESLPRVVQSLVVANVFVTGVSCGREHTMALGEMMLPETKDLTRKLGGTAYKATGLVFAFGWGEAGRLGIGEAGAQPYPVLVETLAFGTSAYGAGGAFANAVSSAMSMHAESIVGYDSASLSGAEYNNAYAHTPSSAVSMFPGGIFANPNGNNTRRIAGGGLSSMNGKQYGDERIGGGIGDNTQVMYSVAERLRRQLGLDAQQQQPVAEYINYADIEDDATASESGSVILDDLSVSGSRSVSSVAGASTGYGAAGVRRLPPLPSSSLNSKMINSAMQITHIVCGREHTLCTSSNGRVFAFGAGSHGRLGLGNEDDVVVPIAVTGGGILEHRVISCGAGEAHSLALCADGHVYSWGFGDSGALGHGSEESFLTPKQIETFAEHNIAEIYTISEIPTSPQNKEQKQQQQHISTSTFIVQVACGAYHSSAIDSEGGVWTWGDGEDGQLGSATQGDDASHRALKPTLIDLLQSGNDEGGSEKGREEEKVKEQKQTGSLKTGSNFCVQLACGNSTTSVVTRSGTLFTWGSRSSAEDTKEEGVDVNNKAHLLPRHVPLPRPVRLIACGSLHMVAISDRESLQMSATPSSPSNNHEEVEEVVVEEEEYQILKEEQGVVIGDSDDIIADIALMDDREAEEGEQDDDQMSVVSNATDLEEGKEEDSPMELWSDAEWSKFVEQTNWAGVGINVHIPNPNPAGTGETVDSDNKDQTSVIHRRVLAAGVVGSRNRETRERASRLAEVQRLKLHLAGRFASFVHRTQRLTELNELGLGLGPTSTAAFPAHQHGSAARCCCETCNLTSGVWPLDPSESSSNSNSYNKEQPNDMDAMLVREGFWQDDDGSGSALITSNLNQNSTNNSISGTNVSAMSNTGTGAWANMTPVDMDHGDGLGVLWEPRNLSELNAKEVYSQSSGLGGVLLTSRSRSSVLSSQDGPSFSTTGSMSQHVIGELDALSYGDLYVRDASANAHGLTVALVSARRAMNATQRPATMVMWGQVPNAIHTSHFSSSGQDGSTKPVDTSGDGEISENPPKFLAPVRPATAWKPLPLMHSQGGREKGSVQHSLVQVSCGRDRVVCVSNDGLLYQLKLERQVDGRMKKQQSLALMQALRALEAVAPPMSSTNGGGGDASGAGSMSALRFGFSPSSLASGVKSYQWHTNANPNTLDGQIQSSSGITTAQAKYAKALSKNISNRKGRRQRRKNRGRGGGGSDAGTAKRRGPRVPLLYQGGFEFPDMTREDEKKYRTVLRVRNIYGAYSTTSGGKRGSSHNSKTININNKFDTSAFFRRLVAQFDNREPELMIKLQKKYGLEPPMVEMAGPDGWARETPKLIRCRALEGQKIVQVACGEGHSLALSQSGRVFSWGDGSCGRLGLGIQTLVGTHGVVEEPQQVQFNNNNNIRTHVDDSFIVQVSCGGAHSAAVTAEGSVYMWGGGGWGQLGIGMRAHRALPTHITIPLYLSKYRISSNDSNIKPATPPPTTNTSRGVEYRKGNTMKHTDSTGSFGDISVMNDLQVRTTTTQPVARKVSCGRSHTAVLTQCGHVCVFGRGLHGRLGLGDQLDRLLPSWVNVVERRELSSAVSVVVVSDDDASGGVRAGGGGVLVRARVPVSLRVHDVSAGDEHTVFFATRYAAADS